MFSRAPAFFWLIEICGFVRVGATRPQYAPEPLDVGKKLQVDIVLPDGSRESLATSGPVDAGKLQFF